MIAAEHTCAHFIYFFFFSKYTYFERKLGGEKLTEETPQVP